MKEQINLNDVIQSLATQVQDYSLRLASTEAVIKAKDVKIKELEEEVENLRKEQIAEMDEDSPK